MQKELDITHKLNEIVKKRKTPVIVTKQDPNHGKKRRSSSNTSYETYSYDVGE